MNPTKPGIQTSEFWLAVLTTVANLLVGVGILKSANQPLIQALAVVLATVVPAVYVWGRSTLKAAALKPPP